MPELFTDEDVRQIKALIEALEDSTLDFLELHLGEMKLTLGRGLPLLEPTVGAETHPATAGSAQSIDAVNLSVTEPSSKRPSAENAMIAPNGVPITAPMIGTFYDKPQPGAAPFVQVGSLVENDTTVALIEVMKVFTSVDAATSGTITEICAEEGQLVEYGQILFRVQPKP